MFSIADCANHGVIVIHFSRSQLLSLLFAKDQISSVGLPLLFLSLYATLNMIRHFPTNLNFSARLMLLVILLAPFLWHAQIPHHPNRIDHKGKRQGTWTVLFDKDSLAARDSIATKFYRVITYLNDKPVGIVNDYFKNGKQKFKSQFFCKH